MTLTDFLVKDLASNLQMLNMTLADFSDADLLVRPTPGANNTAWQLGHLIVAETNMGNGVRPGSMPELPAGFADRFTKKTASVDDGKLLGTKDDLLGLLSRARAATIAWLKPLSAQDLDAPGPEKMRDFAPTVADVAALQSGHVMMHIGQFQVIRRKLGKPVLF